MAITVTTEQSWTSEVEWEASTGKYQLKRTYRVICSPAGSPENILEIPNSDPPLGVPAYVDWIDPYGRTGQHYANVPLRLWEVGRGPVVRLNQQEFSVTSTYTGHELGVIRDDLDMSGATQPIMISLDVDTTTTPPTHKGIGANMEGTQRILPRIVRRILQNVTKEFFWEGFSGTTPPPGGGPAIALPFFFTIYALTGSVNEAGWISFSSPTLYAEGTWLYLGAQVTDNLDTTMSLLHSFDFEAIPIGAGGTVPPNTAHRYPWAEYWDTPFDALMGGQIRKRFKRNFGDLQYSKIYPVAGTDIPEKFADLLLAYSWLIIP